MAAATERIQLHGCEYLDEQQRQQRVSYMVGLEFSGLQETTRTKFEAEGYTLLFGVVLEQGKTSYLGPLSSDCQDRGQGAENAKEGVKGWAGWIPRSAAEKSKFQELILSSSGDNTDICKDGCDGLGGHGQSTPAEKEQILCAGWDQGDGG